MFRIYICNSFIYYVILLYIKEGQVSTVLLRRGETYSLKTRELFSLPILILMFAVYTGTEECWVLTQYI